MFAATVDHNRQDIEFLPDYCPRCNPLGHNADSRLRAATLTEPVSVTPHGRKGARCDYQCRDCGHRWHRTDLWTAKHAGLDQKQRRAA